MFKRYLKCFFHACSHPRHFSVAVNFLTFSVRDKLKSAKIKELRVFGKESLCFLESFTFERLHLNFEVIPINTSYACASTVTRQLNKYTTIQFTNMQVKPFRFDRQLNEGRFLLMLYNIFCKLYDFTLLVSLEAFKEYVEYDTSWIKIMKTPC